MLDHVWLDLQLYVLGPESHVSEASVRRAQVLFAQKNANRVWLYEKIATSASRPRTTILPWPGRPPTGFNNLRSSFVSLLRRGFTLQVSDALSAHRILEHILELLLLEYPPSISRALLHSLPPWPSVLLARR